MSAMGQKQTCAVHKLMSAKGHKRTCNYACSGSNAAARGKVNFGELVGLRLNLD